MNKRAGFTSRYLRHKPIVRERFDTVFGTFPNRLYVLTDMTSKYAITGEENSDYIVMKPVDKKNKYQWVLVDADTGTICFFTDLKNYMSITMIEGQVNVKRSDILKNGTFTFNSDYTISLKNGYDDYCLAFKKSLPSTTGGTTGTSDANGSNSTENTNASTDAAPATEEKKEGFFSHLFSNFSRARRERFDAKVDIPLEVVKTKGLDLETYSNTWKFDLVYDLRELTDNADTIQELTTANSSGDTQIKALQQLVENNKKQFETELGYKDTKLKEYTDLINKYEDNWFVKTFLKEKE